MPHSSDFSLTLNEVADVCNAQTVGISEDSVIRGVSTDTRALAPGELFFALEGETHDGHDYLTQALEAGAVAAVVSQPAAVPEGLPAIIVDDTEIALGRIAAAHRSRMGAKIAAITGSTGKTTTKDMLGDIMSLAGPAVVAHGTQNNEIGVPLTLLRLTSEHEFGVLELAMRGPGEIDYLAEMVLPDVGVITNIGQSHVGRLGSREAIAQAKAELLEHLSGDGAAVLNADDFFFSVFTAMTECDVISFGIAADADFHAREIDDARLDGVSFELVTPSAEAKVTMQVPGRHNVLNALAAAAAASRLGASLEKVVAGLESYQGSAMRTQRVTGPNGSTIINDAYNASPDSVAAALDLLRAAPADRRIFVFGDMLEMGPEAEPAHRAVGDAAKEAGVDHLVAVGRLAALAATRAQELGLHADSVSDTDEARAILADELAPGDVMLVKGSRGMQLERIVEALSDGN